MLFYVLQLLNLLEVIIDSAGSKSTSFNKSQVSTSELPSAPQISSMEADVNTDLGIMTSGVDTSAKAVDSSKPTTSDNDKADESQRVLSNLPQAELRLLCSLLAQEG